ncbi:unnamed protein product [Wuchereria bancrofti]|uniref:Very-long-chain (3R)-3-hydroxyacyl-CoA dehydratase n=1 Tax=Wuchereria bancrofti TaxID=6293 RepID=A0A3P7E7S9_WUCBA|nr:unnamed protein product [Wuchereria bancrofti]
MTVRRPFVYWAQDERLLFLTIDLKDSSDVSYAITGNSFEFRATGIGAHGRCEYSFQLSLFADVELEKAGQGGGSKLLYVLKKTNAMWWPTILNDGSRYSWLRVGEFYVFLCFYILFFVPYDNVIFFTIDFDRFEDPDGSDTEDDYEMINMNARTPEAQMDAITQRILDECRTKPKTKTDFINDVKQFAKKCNYLLIQYLCAYNITLFILHVYLLFTLVFNFFTIGNAYYNSFWQSNANIIKIVTALQLIDVAHALVGYTKGNYRIGLIQVCGRLAFIYIIDGCPDVQSSPTTFILIFAYFSIEIFRYPYYADVKKLKFRCFMVTILVYPV